MTFSEDFPFKPPKCKFRPALFHPNLYPSGTVCLSILDEDADWRSTLTVADILLGIQRLLGEPNEESPAHPDAYKLFVENEKEYVKKILQ